jgi:AraC-like DNA-binding protein
MNIPEKINDSISRNLEDTEMDVEKLAKLMNMSKPTLYRKIKSLSDLSPNELINITRLQEGSRAIG